MSQRIEYIDAMRGFTMILVVYSHICLFCLGDASMGFNNVFILFRLPCFFFISGWLFFKPGLAWDWPTARQVVRRKLAVQLLPTFIFLLLLAPPPLFFSRLGATKGGYWFTFALFEFFVLYILSVWPFRLRGGSRVPLLLALVISAAAFCYDVFYSRMAAGMGLWSDVLGFLSFMTWRYYLFFFLGTLARQHSDTFLRLTDNRWVTVGVVLGFCLVALMPRTDDVWLLYARFAVGGILGVVMVFTFFRSFASLFTKERLLGRALQYVGTRTLDIYLLHYFFLPRFLMPYGDGLRSLGSPWLELVVALVVALLVLLVCLAVSGLIRLSPFLGHYLFGVKYECKE